MRKIYDWSVAHAINAQQRMCNVSAHPLAAPIAMLFLGIWIGAFFASAGKFDPGLGIGNLIINGLGLVLMFCSCAISALALAGHQDTQERLDRHEEHLQAIREKTD